MAKVSPTDRVPVPARQEWRARLLRFLWPLPGALMGAALGLNLYFRQPGLNTDSLAPLVFASVWALGGLLAGTLVAASAGGLIERGLRRLCGPVAACGLTLLCLVVVCGGLYAPLELRLPKLFWPAHAQEPVPVQPPARIAACAQPAPTDPALRKSWALECR
ncbi:MAG: hypothetical protein HXX19_10930 [Rhodoferax sp.]|nr:hypothetical protein [Rhodoferax sp.]